MLRGKRYTMSGTNFPSLAVRTFPWNLDSLSEPPSTYPADDMTSSGVKAILYEGLPFQGKPTRVFAWYGIPKSKAGQKTPAMVLVHGGGGTAYADWVRLWVSRGYAAIAMDLCGAVPTLDADISRHHEWAGPPGWGGFDQMDWPQTDQWCYHAVADILLANSLIRSMPEVDPERVGITGISWGGYLTCIAAAIDHRFKFAAPVYGCGFLLDDTDFTDYVKLLGPVKAEQWMTWWDPGSYLSQVTIPMLWVTGSNDTSYPLNALQKSYRLPSGSRTLAVRLRMPHAHGGPGENPEEIHSFAEFHLNNGIPLTQIKEQGREGNHAWTDYESTSQVVKAELNFTKAEGVWRNREWASIPAEIGSEENQVSALLPEESRVYYFNLTDERGLVVSTEHVEVTLPSAQKLTPTMC